MALDATPSGPNSNSYLTQAEADEYNSRTGNGATWSGLSSGEKDSLLQWATLIIESSYTFMGNRTTLEQRLSWPRAGVVYDGQYLDNNLIPRQVKDAAAEFARQLYGKDFTAELSTDAVKMVKLGSLSVDFKSSQEQLAKIVPDMVDLLLKPFVGRSLIGGGIRISR